MTAQTIVGYIERIDRPEGKNARFKIGSKLYFATKNTNTEMSTLYNEGDIVEVTYLTSVPKEDGSVFYNVVGVKHATEEDYEKSKQRPLTTTPDPEIVAQIERHTGQAFPQNKKVPDAYTVVVQGRRIITAAGLIKLAHDHGFKNYTVLKFEHDDKTAFAHVRVDLKNGSFEAVASANVAHARGNMAQHVIELAETRALNRALRRGLPVDFTDIEDLFDTEDNKEATEDDRN